MCGACPRMSNAAASSSTNRFGEAVRFLRHQLSISRICESASGGFGPAGSTLPTQFVENSRRGLETARLGGSPGRCQRFVQGAPLLVSEVIAFIVANQIHNRPLG